MRIYQIGLWTVSKRWRKIVSLSSRWETWIVRTSSHNDHQKTIPSKSEEKSLRMSKFSSAKRLVFRSTGCSIRDSTCAQVSTRQQCVLLNGLDWRWHSPKLLNQWCKRKIFTEMEFKVLLNFQLRPSVLDRNGRNCCRLPPVTASYTSLTTETQLKKPRATSCHYFKSRRKVNSWTHKNNTYKYIFLHIFIDNWPFVLIPVNNNLRRYDLYMLCFMSDVNPY